MTRPGPFKRMVIGLPQSMTNRAAVDAAAALAEDLHIELLATFLADDSLHTLAGLPAVRELRLLEQGWQAIDFEQIARDIDRAAGVARRRIAEIAGGRAIETHFDIVTGAAMLASKIRADDIVAIIEPAHPGEPITTQFTGLFAAAMATAAAVLVLPHRIARTAGPVVAVAAGPADPSIRVALGLAAALKERLIVLTRFDADMSVELISEANRLGVAVERIAALGPASDVFTAVSFLPAARERLRVVTGSGIPDDALRLFSTLRGVPLLVVEPRPQLA